jgi:hypothetical protein
MKNNRLPVLTLITVSLYVCINTVTAYSAKIYSVREMEGTISVLIKKSKIMSVGDTVKVNIDAGLVVQGDRLSVFEPFIQNKRKPKNEDETGEPLAHVGEIAITGIRGKNVYGEITSASKEMANSSFVRTVYSNRTGLAGSPEFLGFLRKIASAKLNNPVEDILHVGITDTVNENGDVTGATAEISRKFRNAVCNRVQFNCAHTKQIKATLSKYGVATSDSIGKFIRKVLNREAGVDILITSKLEYVKDSSVITLVAWDLKSEMKSEPYIIADPTRAGSGSEFQGEVLEKFQDISHGSLKITLNSNGFTGVRRVDYLHTIDMEDIVYKRYIPDISGRFTESVAWKDISVTLDGERYSPQAESVVYDSVLPAKNYLLRISATPVLAGDRSVLLGDRLEESFELEIPPDTAIHTEIILKTRGKKAILIVDSVPVI